MHASRDGVTRKFIWKRVFLYGQLKFIPILSLHLRYILEVYPCTQFGLTCLFG